MAARLDRVLHVGELERLRTAVRVAEERNALLEAEKKSRDEMDDKQGIRETRRLAYVRGEHIRTSEALADERGERIRLAVDKIDALIEASRDQADRVVDRNGPEIERIYDEIGRLADLRDVLKP